MTNSITRSGVGYDARGNFVVQVEYGEGQVVTHYTTNPEHKICPLCEKGWTMTAESVLDQAEVAPLGTVHDSCWIKKLALDDVLLLWDALQRSAVKVAWEPTQIPSQYWAGNSLRSKRWWYIQRIPSPHLDVQLIFGRRKRVYSISLTPLIRHRVFSEDLIRRAEEVFKEVESTKAFTTSEFVVHAWTDDEAKRYISDLIGVVQ